MFLAAGIMFSSCKKDAAIQMDAAVQHIPSDATQVTVVRIPQLMKKVDFNSLREMDFYKQMIEEAAGRDALVGKILYEPSESGINMEQNAYIISDINPNNPDQMVNGMMMNIADATKFAEVIKSSPMSTDQKQGDGFQYSTQGDNFMAWSDEFAFFGQAKGFDLKTQLNKVFNVGEGASVLSSESFEKAGSSTDDISFMVSTDALAQNPQLGIGAMTMGWSQDDLIGNYLNGSVNFEDQKMTIDLDILLKKIIQTDLGMPFKSSISTDFSSYIPNDNLSGAFTFGLNPKGLLQILKEKNVAGLLNNQAGLDQLGLSLDDIANALGGDMMLAIQKEGSEGKPAGIFSMSINEKEFQPFVDKMVEMGLIASEGKGSYKLNDASLARDFDEALGGKGEFNNPSIIIKDGKLFVTADPVLKQGAENGGLARGQRIDSSLYKEISSGFLGGKGFPLQLEGLIPDVEKSNIKSFVFNMKNGNAQVELTSTKDGNFLKSMIESSQSR